VKRPSSGGLFLFMMSECCKQTIDWTMRTTDGTGRTALESVRRSDWRGRIELAVDYQTGHKANEQRTDGHGGGGGGGRRTGGYARGHTAVGELIKPHKRPTHTHAHAPHKTISIEMQHAFAAVHRVGWMDGSIDSGAVVYGTWWAGERDPQCGDPSTASTRGRAGALY